MKGTAVRSLVAQEGAPFGPTQKSQRQPRFQLPKARCADFLSHFPRETLSELLMSNAGTLSLNSPSRYGGLVQEAAGRLYYLGMFATSAKVSTL